MHDIITKRIIVRNPRIFRIIKRLHGWSWTLEKLGITKVKRTKRSGIKKTNQKSPQKDKKKKRRRERKR